LPDGCKKRHDPLEVALLISHAALATPGKRVRRKQLTGLPAPGWRWHIGWPGRAVLRNAECN
jgi:hypothetical protein